MKNDPKYIIIHCTDMSYRTMPDQFVACNGWHRDRSFPVSSLGLYIGYHRLITGGVNYKCRLETDEGAHCNQRVDGTSMNFQSLGICVGFAGNVEFPTPADYALLQKQVWEWQDFYKIPNDRVKFHREYATGKTCPGSLITSQWLTDLLTRPAPVPTTASSTACIVHEKIIAEQKEELGKLARLIAALKALLKLS